MFVVGRDIAVMHGEFVVSVFCSQFVDAGGLILSRLMMKEKTNVNVNVKEIER